MSGTIADVGVADAVEAAAATATTAAATTVNSETAVAELAIPAQAAELRAAAAWLQAAADARGVPAEASARLDMCLHEALANILDHGGLAADAAGLVRLSLTVRDGAATLTLIDAGRPFDPTLAPAPARPRTLEDTLPGGLGVVMIRSLADALAYRRENDNNHLGISVHWSAA